jgi:hypothetical protein
MMIGDFRRRVPVLLTALVMLAAAGCGDGHDDRPGSTVPSVARAWDEAILSAIRIDVPHPPVHARNLWHFSLAMYDAWAVYDPIATGWLVTEKITGLVGDARAAARREAISYAAYRVLSNRYALAVDSKRSQEIFDGRMAELGYDIAVTTTEGNTPAAVGNRVGAAVITFGDTDGSNQAGRYQDPTYAPVNEPLIVAVPGTVMVDPNRWQPLSLDAFVSQNGIPIPISVQKFLGPQWNGVTPFALVRTGDPAEPYLDPGPPPRLGTATDVAFKQSAVDLILRSSRLDPTDGAVLDASPATQGNNPLGTDDGDGYTANPVTGAPYPPQIVPVGDFGRVLAEFWADGPQSETPPGHWNVLANEVSDDPTQTFRRGGEGEPLDRLAWDVQLYFTLNAAVHDAAVQCWGTKRVYDSVRPISMIRYMGGLGQSSDPADVATYDPEGLPLVEGLIEVVTDATRPAGRHAALRCCVSNVGLAAPCVDANGGQGTPISCVGEIAIRSWPGEPADRANAISPVRFVRAVEWVPYQRKTFVTPAFAGYTSGHSTFSRSAAEALTAFTGSPWFPGGFHEFVARQNAYLTFERGPSTEVRLQWVSYYDAADQAGQSRRWGGIHIAADDYNGRIAGSRIGRDAYARALAYYEGRVDPAP